MTSRKVIINKTEYDLNSNKVIGFSFFDKSNYLQKAISPIGVDLLYFGLAVCLADRKIMRSDSLDGWTRDLELIIPVTEIDKWKRNNDKIVKMLNFLSGDNWTIKYVKSDFPSKPFKQQRSIKKTILGENEEIDISMLSAGLDSYIGAIDLCQDKKKTVFVNIHSSGNSYLKDFMKVRDSLVFEYNIQNPDQYFFTFGVTPKKGGKKMENTTRARSLLFFTHALALSTCFNNVKRLIIPENGTISLNVPLTMGRYGSSSTRTTHPYYLNLLRDIIRDMGIDLEIVNPYQFSTKGEMILKCKNGDFLRKNITLTMSCSHPASGRYAGRGLGHCGLCLPCIIRKAAEYKAYNELVTKYTDLDLKDDFKKTRENQSTIRCFKYRMAQVEHSNIYIDIQKNGILIGDLNEYANLYKRSIDEIKLLIDKYYSIKEQQ